MEPKRMASVVSLMKRVALRGPECFGSRKPVPRDPARPSLAGFPDHLLSLILEHLAEDDLIKVSTICLSLYEQARYVQHRVVRISLDHEHREHVKKRLDLVVRRRLQPAIRVLEVTGMIRFRVDEEEAKEILDQLGSLIVDMTGLRHLHWQLLNPQTTAALPPTLLNSLPVRSRLHVSFYCGAQGAAAARDFLLCLKNNQNLQTVTYEVMYFESPQEMPTTMAVLQEVLLSCPNLTRLYAKSADPSVRELTRLRQFIGLNLADGEIPAAVALEEIGLGAYDWGARCLGGQDGLPDGPRPEHLHWAEKLDWSRLTKLHDADEMAAQHLVPKMTNLKYLELGPDQPDPSRLVAQVCSPLEGLSLAGHMWAGTISKNSHQPHALNIAAAKFGASLRELRVHGAGVDAYYTLELDAKMDSSGGGNGGGGDKDNSKNNDPPWAVYLDAIAEGFPSLRTLELWTKQHDSSSSPPVAAGAARRMFARLRERNQHIQRLVLHSGSINQSGEFSISVDCGFISLECTVAYKSDASGDHNSYIRVTSPDLGSELNLCLDDFAQMTEGDERRPTWSGDVSKLDERSMLLKAALEGPQVRRDWEKWRANLPPWNQHPGGSVRRNLRNARYMARIAKEVTGGEF
ncbi:hypothetical protein PG988_003706 [Apiospora saccharicola]